MRTIRQLARAAIAIATLAVVACGPDAPTATSIASADRSAHGSVTAIGLFEVPADCRDCVVGPVEFARQESAPQSETISFPADARQMYVVDLDDLGSQGADASVSLNGVILLSNRGTAKASQQHYQALMALAERNNLVVRLLGKPGSLLRVAIWRYRPVTLDAVTLAPGTVLEVAGPITSFNATITNHTIDAIPNVQVSATIEQIGASRVASESAIGCGAGVGVLPRGTCLFPGEELAVRNLAPGFGLLTAGPAIAVVRVRDGTSNVLDSLVVPIVLTGPAVASVSIAPPTATIKIGDWVQLTATLRDAEGNILVGRFVTWSSNLPQIATVSSDGRVTGVGPPGTATISASSGGKTGTALITVTSIIVTGIGDIRLFLDRCPTSDDAYAQIRQDFEIRVDGQLVTAPLTCTEPYSALPIDQLTDELIAVQVLRTAYYMSRGTEGKLPWTPKALYAWMTSHVAGVNLKTAPGQLYCCDVIDGKLYISTSRQDAFQRDFKRTWPGIASSLNFYAHEIRHADPGAPGHTTGCAAFPLPTDPAGCDASYDLGNLGSYGVQYWLESKWATGYLNIGIGCAPTGVARDYAIWDENSANTVRSRFVSNVPPMITATQPYGGACVTTP